MLVLRRKQHEAILIKETITVRVLAIEGRRVLLGIDAPPEVQIVRQELRQQSLPPPSRGVVSVRDPLSPPPAGTDTHRGS